jgi:hypothetical protein
VLRADCSLASAADMGIPVCVEDGPAIMKIVREHHAAWKQAQSKLRASRQDV